MQETVAVLSVASALINYWSMEGAISFRNARVLVMVAPFEGPDLFFVRGLVKFLLALA